jgi:hypothetical protein
VKRSVHTAKYVKVIEQLGAEMGNAHGWQRRAAERLGISAEHLTRILKGDREVGRMLAERAVERLGLDPAYFSDSRKTTVVSGAPAVVGHDLEVLLSRFDVGAATAEDVFALARAVVEAPAVREAQTILDMRKPRNEKELGALFMAASRLIAALPNAGKTRHKR